jgi:ABC-type lipoprotein export system ATPase subunit
MAEPLVWIDHVSRVHDEGRVVSLQDVELRVDAGEFVAVTGPSGSGKSTLLNMMSGLDRPSSGRVFFEGVEPLTRHGWAAIRARRIGYVFQRFNLLATLTALQNVEIAMFGVVRDAATRRRRAQELLERVGLQLRARHFPYQLSVGERQRVAIARSLANAPAVILADEPTGNLDTKSAVAAIELLKQTRANDGITLVVVTHDAKVAAHAPRVVTLEDGRVVRNERRP